MDIEKGIEEDKEEKQESGNEELVKRSSELETQGKILQFKIEGQREKSTRGMPWHWEPKKDAADCEKPRGAVSRQRSVDIRMEESD